MDRRAFVAGILAFSEAVAKVRNATMSIVL
jgi:hypothetical protein